MNPNLKGSPSILTLDDLKERGEKVRGQLAALKLQLNENTEQLRKTREEIAKTSAGDDPRLFRVRVAKESSMPADLHARGQLQVLTPREIEVLRLIADGRSTKELASDLSITFKTAVTHRTNILAKLHFHETASLVRFAIRAGIVRA